MSELIYSLNTTKKLSFSVLHITGFLISSASSKEIIIILIIDDKAQRLSECIIDKSMVYCNMGCLLKSKNVYFIKNVLITAEDVIERGWILLYSFSLRGGGGMLCI